MTSPYVDIPNRRQQPWRTVLVALACLLAPPPAVVAGWIALIVWTGCFMSCPPEGGDHLTGGALFLLATVLLLLGPALAWVLLRRWSAVAVAVAGVVGVLVVGGAIVGAN